MKKRIGHLAGGSRKRQPKPTESAIYRLAAEHIEQGVECFSCCAVSYAARDIRGGDYDKKCSERLRYQKLFGPTPGAFIWFGWGKKDRILALLLMAEIAKDNNAKNSG